MSIVAKRKPVLIGCPQYRELVRGSYECDESGRYMLGAEGQFVLRLVRCGQRGGRCMETLCALHRFNKGGGATWYPSEVLAMREPSVGRSRPTGSIAKVRRSARARGGMDVLA